MNNDINMLKKLVVVSYVERKVLDQLRPFRKVGDKSEISSSSIN